MTTSRDDSEHRLDVYAVLVEFGLALFFLALLVMLDPPPLGRLVFGVIILIWGGAGGVGLERLMKHAEKDAQP